METFTMKLAIVVAFSLCLHVLVRADHIDEVMDEKKKAILEEHNKFRSYHDVPTLELSDELNKQAEEYARKFARDPLGFQPSTKDEFPSIYGRSLWMAEGANISDLMTTPELNPVEDWYMEKSTYSGYYHQDEIAKYGHFTQLVWKSTKRLGIAFAWSYNKLMVVCVYDPKGNIPDECNDNILPAKIPYEPSAVKSGNTKVNGDWIYIMGSLLTMCLLTF